MVVYVVLLCIVGVRGVTQLRDVVYIVCYCSSAIVRFNATTHLRLTDIDVKGLRVPSDIVACEQTSQLYVVDFVRVWRVSADGADIRYWWNNPYSNQWRNFKFRAPLQENHSGPLLQKNIGISRTFYRWGLRTEAP